jgi:hypothetical protein
MSLHPFHLFDHVIDDARQLAKPDHHWHRRNPTRVMVDIHSSVRGKICFGHWLAKGF